MEKYNLRYLCDGEVLDTTVHLTLGDKCIMKVKLKHKGELIVEGIDFYDCFRRLREIDKGVVYYCKGAKINVVPSRMTRQMGMGIFVYETALGHQARKENLVNIFDYEDKDLSSDPAQQDIYKEEWFTSLNSSS